MSRLIGACWFAAGHFTSFKAFRPRLVQNVLVRAVRVYTHTVCTSIQYPDWASFRSCEWAPSWAWALKTPCRSAWRASFWSSPIAAWLACACQLRSMFACRPKYAGRATRALHTHTHTHTLDVVGLAVLDEIASGPSIRLPPARTCDRRKLGACNQLACFWVQQVISANWRRRRRTEILSIKILFN